SGSPLAVDFGEEDNTASVSVVEVSADTAAKVREVPITAGTPLRAVRGPLDQLSTADTDDAPPRGDLAQPPRARPRGEVQELLPRALEVGVDPRLLPEADTERPRAQRTGRSPGELFADYLSQKGHADSATLDLFHRLHGEVMS